MSTAMFSLALVWNPGMPLDKLTFLASGDLSTRHCLGNLAVFRNSLRISPLTPTPGVKARAPSESTSLSLHSTNRQRHHCTKCCVIHCCSSLRLFCGKLKQRNSGVTILAGTRRCPFFSWRKARKQSLSSQTRVNKARNSDLTSYHV